MRKPEEYESNPILSLQTMLRTVAMGNQLLISLVPDGVYGSTTMAAVTAFQRFFRLPVTGVADQATWERLVQEFNHAQVRNGPTEGILIRLEPGQVIRAGERNDHVYLIQAMLTVLSREDDSFDTPSMSGALDSATVNSLKRFQQISGLPVTGNADRETYRYLAKVYSAEVGDGRNGC